MKKLIVFFIIYSFFNCVSKKDIVYLQNDEIEQEKISNNYVTYFKPDDLVEINITSSNPESSAPFNLFTAASSDTGGQSVQLPYLIDNKGFVDLPIIGKVKLGGLTREQAISFLKEKLDPEYIKNPKIYIRIINFTVNVNGDVRSPGSYKIPNERVTILDAISLAGDLNITARRDNILVIREKDDKKIEYRVDLRSRKLYSSPVFYLQQNDNIYVEPNYASIQSASNNSNTTLFISSMVVLISIISFLR